jgi:hypothetical protein
VLTLGFAGFGYPVRLRDFTPDTYAGRPKPLSDRAGSGMSGVSEVDRALHRATSY